MEYELTNGRGYSPDASERRYQPPPAPQPFTAPPVTAAALTAEGTAVERAHQAMTHAHNEFQRHTETTNGLRDKFSDDGYREQLQAFASTPAAQAVDTALADVQARRDAAQHELDTVRESLSANGDTAAELRATRCWQRTQSLLAAAKEPSTVARQAIAQASREQLGVLLQELPAYLQTRNIPSDWIDTEVSRTVPEYAAARQRLAKADKAFQVTRHNATSLRRVFEQGHGASVLVSPTPYDPDSE